MAFTKHRRLWTTLTIILVILLSLIPLFWGTSNSPAFPNQSKQTNAVKYNFVSPSGYYIKGREVVKVGLYVMRITNFDVTTGTYQIDFFLNFLCSPAPCDPTQFEIVNAISEPEVIDQTDAESLSLKQAYSYRVHANMQTQVSVREFPFDTQTLTIELEDKNKARVEYVLIPDQNLSGLDPSVSLPGWSAIPQMNGFELEHYYSVYDVTYSRAVIEIIATNPLWESFLRTILPVMVLTFAGIISFFMKYDRAGDRLSIVTSALVSTVLFSLSFPKGATYMSAFMLANYLILVFALATTVRLMTLVNTDKHDEAMKLHNITDNLFPIAWLITQVLLIVYGLIIFDRF